ncbi:hypothetical protein B0H19DRAFT_231600 [Mycena capillaripes]|nr:hypothetical protein B0H19DRAFT_231600 [Mycena capillaripes]
MDIPPDIFEVIIDNFENDRETLLVCSLVCSSFVPRSRHYLFRQCRIHLRNVLAFGQLLDSPLCSFLPHVRRVIASRHFKKAADRGFDAITDGLRRLMNVETLELSGVINTRTRTDFNRGFLSAFQGLAELRLVGTPTTNPERIIHLICAFPVLQRLVVSTPLTFLVGSSSVYSLPPQSLHTVVATKTALKPITSWLLASNHMKKLRSFSAIYNGSELHPSDPLSLPSVLRRSLEQAGSSLQHLELSVQTEFEPHPYYDLSTHINLRSVTIIILLWLDKPSYLSTFITRLSSPYLETVSFGFHGDGNGWKYMKIDWESIDAFLACQVRFPSFREVYISRADSRLPALLPLLRKSGRIKIAET